MSFHVRRQDREITNANEMRQVLKTAKYVTIALCMDNQPYLVTLNHGYDQTHNCLYFHCANEGKKLVYAQANPRVWVQAVLDFGVTDECDYAYASVHFQGTLSLITEAAEKRHALETLVRQASNRPEEKIASVKPEKLVNTTMGKIDITFMSGKKHQAPTKPSS
jgi:nitroimidazol reductase NimA-like FMN-containing flavoprotein (pyridoxamine 5'-phosphate oxidase superfamily)